jgi:hypothetical protein
MRRMGRLKAASIINTIELARGLVGEPRFGEMISTLPPATQALLGRRILPVEWIEADHWLPFQQAMLYEHFEGDEMPFREFIRKVCERDFNTFYKLIIRMIMSPDGLLERTAKLWSTYSDSGRLEVAGREKLEVGQRVTLKLSGFQSEYSVFGILLHAFVEQLLQMSGARAVEVRRPVNRVVLGEVETELIAEYG